HTPPLRLTAFPYTPLFRSPLHRLRRRADATQLGKASDLSRRHELKRQVSVYGGFHRAGTDRTGAGVCGKPAEKAALGAAAHHVEDRKSTRLNSSHVSISYA